MRADVYYNLRLSTEKHPCYSIRSRERVDYGIVRYHAEKVKVYDVDFKIQSSGHERALQEGQRNIHAFVRGDIIFFSYFNEEKTKIFPLNSVNITEKNHCRFTYDINSGEFIDVENGRFLLSADIVAMNGRKKLAINPIYKNE